MARIQKKYWREYEKAKDEIEKIKPSVAAFPQDEEIRQKLRHAKKAEREAYRLYGRAGQAAINWKDWAAQIEGILHRGLPEKGMSIVGVFWGKGR